MQAPLAATAGTRLQPQCGALALHAAGMSLLTFLEGKGSLVNVAPSEAGLGVKFLQMKEKMKADVEARTESVVRKGPKVN